MITGRGKPYTSLQITYSGMFAIKEKEDQR